jgi:hypothetical protein
VTLSLEWPAGEGSLMERQRLAFALWSWSARAARSRPVLDGYPPALPAGGHDGVEQAVQIHSIGEIGPKATLFSY